VRRLLIGVLVTAALAIPAAAAADSCANFSRAPADCGFTCSGPVFEGNWVWLPSIHVPVPAWGFFPPGAADSTQFGLPGANGNYTDGQTSSLLGMSALCPTGNGANTTAQDARQGDHGIQTGCE